MAIYTYSNAHFSFAGTDISDHVKSLTLNTGVETNDKTAMGDSTRLMKAGLSTWTVDVELHGDFAATTELDALVAGLTGNEAALVIRPDAGSIGASNPEWTGTGLVSSYTPMSGSVGDLGVMSMSIVAASALTRATS